MEIVRGNILYMIKIFTLILHFIAGFIYGNKVEADETIPTGPEPIAEPAPVPEPPKPEPVPTPEPIKPKYLFDTPQNARHSVRVICDEEGLVWHDKNVITACIEQESAFKNWVTNENKRNGKVVSTDWGICQINDYWHIGPGKSFPSVEYVVGNPDIVIRFMIRMMKAGKLGLWVSYSTGAYKKYMPQ